MVILGGILLIASLIGLIIIKVCLIDGNMGDKAAIVISIVTILCLILGLVFAFSDTDDYDYKKSDSYRKEQEWVTKNHKYLEESQNWINNK